MRCACIDIGSNTTRLLVAEPEDGGLREVLAQRVFTRLRGVDDRIPDDKVGEVARTVAAQAKLARDAGADVVVAVATAAIRGASNGEQLCDAVREECGMEVAVLSGEEEARLAFLGATRTAGGVSAETLAVVDVGGGSSEIVCGDARGGGVAWARSLPFGSGTLTDRLVHSDPPTAAELDAVHEAIDAGFGGLEPPAVSAGYAVGGSATSLRRLIGDTLDAGSLDAAIGAICSGPAEDVAQRFDLHVERVRVLPAGMLVLAAAGRLLGVPMQIGCGGLREGVILERLASAD